MNTPPTLTVTRYLTPLREGGSLPAIVEADNEALYAMKFLGAGQGAKALIAELIAGALATALDLPLPELVLLNFDPLIGRSEPDPEIQDILHKSVGLNMGLGYLSGALPFDPSLDTSLDPLLLSRIVWFDAYITNVDRTPRNINLLLWQEKLWLIDHGASLYFHHSWQNYEQRAESAFPLIKEHALLPFATQLAEADSLCRAAITPPLLEHIVNLIPESWFDTQHFPDPASYRAAYLHYLQHRLAHATTFVQEAQRAHAEFV